MVYLSNNRNGCYFILNKHSDFLQGYGENIRYLATGVTIQQAKLRDGWYFTRIFDSGEKKMKWQQMLFEGDILSEASVSFYIYASDIPELTVDNRQMSIEELIQSDNLKAKEKMAIMSDCLVLKVRGLKDVLLHQITGLYLWMVVHLKMQGDDNPDVTKIKLVFPKKSLM